jgi:hypothetical protein
MSGERSHRRSEQRSEKFSRNLAEFEHDSKISNRNSNKNYAGVSRPATLRVSEIKASDLQKKENFEKKLDNSIKEGTYIFKKTPLNKNKDYELNSRDQSHLNAYLSRFKPEDREVQSKKTQDMMPDKKTSIKLDELNVLNNVWKNRGLAPVLESPKQRFFSQPFSPPRQPSAPLQPDLLRQLSLPGKTTIRYKPASPPKPVSPPKSVSHPKPVSPPKSVSHPKPANRSLVRSLARLKDYISKIDQKSTYDELRPLLDLNESKLAELNIYLSNYDPNTPEWKKALVSILKIMPKKP